MPEDYRFSIERCEVVDKTALIAFREKRRRWLAWLETDEHHAIWQVLSSMVWHDVSFRTIAQLANTNPDSAIHNSLLTEALLNGHFATQVLAIRRLMDKRNDEVISLPRLLKDVRRNIHLFTRENFVAFDGLPYDYEAAQQRVMTRELTRENSLGFFWGEHSGPDAHIPAQRAHEQFDRLTGVRPANRQRHDRLPTQIIDTLDSWLNESEADELVTWSHTLLAHAAGPNSPNRSAIVAAAPTLDKITNSIRCFVRIAEAITGFILFHSGRGTLVPVPQFNQFERLENPLMVQDGRNALDAYWDALSDERNAYLEDVETQLVASAYPNRSTP